MDILRQVIRKLLKETFEEDMTSVESGRGAKQAFSKYVDQKEFKKGTLVHWVGGTKELAKFLENPRQKDEISCNFYPHGGHRDWMAKGLKKPVGVIIEGWVTYATKENAFTGYQSKKPRNKAERETWEHQQASSGFPKRPYEMWKDEESYLSDLRNTDRVKFKAEDLEPWGAKRELGDDGVFWGSFTSIPAHRDWNEVIVDNWKVTGIVYGAVGQYGIRPADIKKMNAIGDQYGLSVNKFGRMM